MQKPRLGDKLGPYELNLFLGKGGNALVWKATAPDGSEVAVKVLKVKNRKSEPFLRFRDEIEGMRQLADVPGVMQLVDFALPESASEPAWIAMPVAQTMEDRLDADSSLAECAEAIRDIARVLAQIHDRGFSHRDIKPSNLYWLDSCWTVGDFGLVDYPGKEPITTDSRKCGPAHYIAPEMINSPSSADGARADAYSLGKTLWRQATGQNFPLPGPHDPSSPIASIASFVLHPRTYPIDALIQEMTAMDPLKRMNASGIAEHLQHWLSNQDQASTSAPIEVSRRIRGQLKELQETRVAHDALIKRASTIYNNVAQALNPIATKLSGMTSQKVTNRRELDANLDAVWVKPSPEGHQVWTDESTVTLKIDAGRHRDLKLRLMTRVTLRSDGRVFIGLGYHVGKEHPAQHPPEDDLPLWSNGIWVDAMDDDVQASINKIADQAMMNLPDAIARLSDHLDR